MLSIVPLSLEFCGETFEVYEWVKMNNYYSVFFGEKKKKTF